MSGVESISSTRVEAFFVKYEPFSILLDGEALASESDGKCLGFYLRARSQGKSRVLDIMADAIRHPIHQNLFYLIFSEELFFLFFASEASSFCQRRVFVYKRTKGMSRSPHPLLSLSSSLGDSHLPHRFLHLLYRHIEHARNIQR